jgi:hypothetical protein
MSDAELKRERALMQRTLKDATQGTVRSADVAAQTRARFEELAAEEKKRGITPRLTYAERLTQLTYTALESERYFAQASQPGATVDAQLAQIDAELTRRKTEATPRPAFDLAAYQEELAALTDSSQLMAEQKAQWNLLFDAEHGPVRDAAAAKDARDALEAIRARAAELQLSTDDLGSYAQGLRTLSDAALAAEKAKQQAKLDEAKDDMLKVHDASVKLSAIESELARRELKAPGADYATLLKRMTPEALRSLLKHEQMRLEKLKAHPSRNEKALAATTEHIRLIEAELGTRVSILPVPSTPANPNVPPPRIIRV